MAVEVCKSGHSSKGKKDNFAMIFAKSRGEICQNLFVFGKVPIYIPILNSHLNWDLFGS